MKRRTENGTPNGVAFTDPREVTKGSPTEWEVKRKIENRTFSLLLLVLLLVVSCTSKKKLVSPMAHGTDYRWMTAKMSGELKMEGEDFPFSGNLRMCRDSTVWVSVSAFMGMESIRTLVTQDSVVLVNRLNQTYLAEPRSVLVETLQVPSLQETQAMLLGDGSADHVEIQWGPYMAKIQYSDIHWDEPTSFPIKINKNYKRMKP